MHYRGWFVLDNKRRARAKVQARPCRIEIAYGPHRSDPDYLEYAGTFFPCRLNKFGAYECASHADKDSGDAPRTGHNADFIPLPDGRIVLDDPPAHPVRTPKPAWVQRYRVDHGFIVPYSRPGRFLAGLVLRGDVGVRESPSGIPYPTTLLGFGAGLMCFVPRLPIVDGQELACPEAPGSRVFQRGRFHLT